MERIDKTAAWVILAIGVVHCGYTFLNLDHAIELLFWFFSGGLALIYSAALNLLRVRYAGLAPGLRSVCVVVNLSLLAFILALAASKGAGIFRNPIAYALVPSAFAAFAFSLRRPSGARLTTQHYD